jgi:hypothetical protein
MLRSLPISRPAIPRLKTLAARSTDLSQTCLLIPSGWHGHGELVFPTLGDGKQWKPARVMLVVMLVVDLTARAS